MKRALILCIVCLVFFGLVKVNSAEEYLSNPSFEQFNALSNPTDWEQFESNTTQASALSSSDWSTHGTYALRLSSPESQTWGSYISVRQQVDFTNILTLTFDAHISVATGPGTGLSINFIDEFDQRNGLWGQSMTGTWYDQSVDVSWVAGVREFEIRLYWGSPWYTGPLTGFVDNIRVSCSLVGEPTDSQGSRKGVYPIQETVYASGACFPANTNLDVYIVEDDTWGNGMSIPTDVSDDGINTIQTDGSGNIGPVAVWSPPLTVGEYDIVFDANQNGVYDAGIDVVNDPNHPGFTVTASGGGGGGAVGGTARMANKFALLMPWMAIAALVVLSVGIIAVRRFGK